MVRRGDVERMIAEGRFDFKGRAELAKRWEVSDAQLYRDRAAIQEDWNRQAGEPIPITRARQAASARRAMEMSFGQKDPAVAVRAIHEEASLLGTHAPKVVEVAGTIAHEHTVTIDPIAMAREVYAAFATSAALLGVTLPFELPPLPIEVEAIEAK